MYVPDTKEAKEERDILIEMELFDGRECDGEETMGFQIQWKKDKLIFWINEYAAIQIIKILECFVEEKKIEFMRVEYDKQNKEEEI